eukprot:1158331-Pelagomonas_calceolata.AAC.3
MRCHKSRARQSYCTDQQGLHRCPPHSESCATHHQSPTVDCFAHLLFPLTPFPAQPRLEVLLWAERPERLAVNRGSRPSCY